MTIRIIVSSLNILICAQHPELTLYCVAVKELKLSCNNHGIYRRKQTLNYRHSIYTPLQQPSKTSPKLPSNFLNPCNHEPQKIIPEASAPHKLKLEEMADHLGAGRNNVLELAQITVHKNLQMDPYCTPKHNIATRMIAISGQSPCRSEELSMPCLGMLEVDDAIAILGMWDHSIW